MCVCAAKEGEAGGEGTRLKSLQVKFLPSTFSSLTSSSGGLRSSASGGCYVRVFKEYLVISLNILSLFPFICLFIFCFVSSFKSIMYFYVPSFIASVNLSHSSLPSLESIFHSTHCAPHHT